MSNIITGARPTIITAGGGLSLTGTSSETEVKAVTIPANLLSLRGAIRITSEWSKTENTANNAVARNRYSGIGGTTYSSGTMVNTSQSFFDQRVIFNAGATNSQKGHSATNTFGLGTGPNTSAADTTAATTVSFTGALALSTEHMTLEWYCVEFIPAV